jgi:hypothetical protein
VQDHARGVDVGRSQGDDFGDTQSGGVGGLQNEAMTEIGHGGEQSRDLVGAEDGRQGLGFLP